MKITRDGSVVIPKKGRNLVALFAIVDDIMLSAISNGAIMRCWETDLNIFIDFEHGQVRTPKDVSTKIKIGEEALLKAYIAYEEIGE